MTDKEALQEIVYMVNDYVNFADHVSPFELIDDLVKFLEENVIHCAMDNNYLSLIHISEPTRPY